MSAEAAPSARGSVKLPLTGPWQVSTGDEIRMSEPPWDAGSNPAGSTRDGRGFESRLHRVRADGGISLSL